MSGTMVTARSQQALHPVMQQALAPFASPPAAYTTPRRPVGCYEHFYTSRDLSVGLTCHLEYSPAERGAREPGTGLQLEPDSPESMTLLSAYLRGVDIIDVLSGSVMQAIEAEALEQMKLGEEP